MNKRKYSSKTTKYTYHVSDTQAMYDVDNSANNVTKVRHHFNVEFAAGERNHTGIEVLQIGELFCDSSYRVMDHLQWCHEISFVISGTAIFQVDEEYHSLSAGDICVSPQGSLHSIESTSPIRYAYVGFNIDHKAARSALEANTLLQIHRALISMSAPILANKEDISRLINMLLDEYHKQQSFGDEIQHHLLMSLLLKLLRSHPEYTLCGNGYEGASRTSGVVYHVIRYVEKNHLVTHTIEQVAEELGYSKFHLSRIFRDQMGQTLQQFMVETRMKRAKHLLTELNNSITEISEQLGYSTTQSFSRSFKTHYGLSPSEFKEQSKGRR